MVFSETPKMLSIQTRPYPHADNKTMYKRRMILELHFNVYHLQRESLLVCILQPRLANKLVEVTVQAQVLLVKVNDHLFILFACWFQSDLFNQPTVFFSRNQPAQTSPETHQRTRRLGFEAKQKLYQSQANNIADCWPQGFLQSTLFVPKCLSFSFLDKQL